MDYRYRELLKSYMLLIYKYDGDFYKGNAEEHFLWTPEWKELEKEVIELIESRHLSENISESTDTVSLTMDDLNYLAKDS